MADYEEILFQVRDGGREVTVTNPTGRRISGLVVEQRRPFGSVWDGAEELVHIVRSAFVTVPPLEPGAQVTLRFGTEVPDAPWVRQPSNKGLTVLDARHDPRSGETRIVVSVCRTQPLCVEGVDPEGVYRVQVDDEPARDLTPRVVRSIKTLLSKQTKSSMVSGRRASTPGTLRFLDVGIVGDEDRFVERTFRISQLSSEEANATRVAHSGCDPGSHRAGYLTRVIREPDRTRIERLSPRKVFRWRALTLPDRQALPLHSLGSPGRCLPVFFCRVPERRHDGRFSACFAFCSTMMMVRPSELILSMVSKTGLPSGGKAERRLIEKDDLGIQKEGARHLQNLLLPAGKIAGELFRFDSSTGNLAITSLMSFWSPLSLRIKAPISRFSRTVISGKSTVPGEPAR